MYTRLRHRLDNRSDKGFTLIELLVVIVIIGILAAIAIPIFLSQRAKATDASAKSDVRTIATNMETYYTDSQAYPATVTPSATGVTPETLTFDATDSAVLSPGNTAAIGLNTGGTAYCIEVKNSQTGDVWTWSSDNGGLQAKGVLCSAVPNAAKYATAVLGTLT